MGKQLLCLVLIYTLLVTACAAPPKPSGPVRPGEVIASSADTCAGWASCASGEVCAVDLCMCSLAKAVAGKVKAFPLDQHPGPLKVVATVPIYDARVADQIQALLREFFRTKDPGLQDAIGKLLPQLIPSWVPSLQAALITRLRAEFIDPGVTLREAQLNEVLTEHRLWGSADFQNVLLEHTKQVYGATFVVLGTASPPEGKFSRVNIRLTYVVTGEVLAAPEAKCRPTKPSPVWWWVLGVGAALAAGAIAAVAIGGGGNGNKAGNVQVTVPPLP